MSSCDLSCLVLNCKLLCSRTNIISQNRNHLLSLKLKWTSSTAYSCLSDFYSTTTMGDDQKQERGVKRKVNQVGESSTSDAQQEEAARIEVGEGSDPIKTAFYKKAKERAMKETKETMAIYTELSNQKNAIEQQTGKVEEEIKVKENELKNKLFNENKLEAKLKSKERVVEEIKSEIQKREEKLNNLRGTLREEEDHLNMENAILSSHRDQIKADRAALDIKHHELKKQKLQAT